MADAILEYTDAGPDLVLEPGDLAQDQGLQTAVLLSLFCDARDEDQPAGVDKRGWWGDVEGDQWGSRLWTIAREVASSGNALIARQTAEASLQWMVEDGIASQIEVGAEYVAAGFLRLSVRIERGSAPEWAHLWEAIEAEFQFEGIRLFLQVT